MKTRLLTHDVWQRLSGLSGRPRKKYVAVPFLGHNARRYLKLRRGDVLVVRFDLGTIKSGATDPLEILYFVSKGVEVHSVENLHAKKRVGTLVQIQLREKSGDVGSNTT